jgi:hypothetical protein
MKRKGTIGLVLIMTLLTSLAYLLGYQHGRTSIRGKLNAVTSLKQIGLGFRVHRNDIGRFNATATVATPSEK